MAEEQYKFALEYKDQNRVDLNYMLTNYVDLKYEEIWSLEFLKKTKQEFKDLSPYYRIVKQGSQLVYISFHIFTIFVVLLMGCMRQSLISFGYMLILLPHIKNGAEVLNQREMMKFNNLEKLEDEIEQLEAEKIPDNGDLTFDEKAKNLELEEKIKQNQDTLLKARLNKKEEGSGQTFKEKQELK
jgi:hypothetical protein